MVKYIFVTGGVVSGLGKGITASSVALLLKARGYKVFMQKFDPYINVNPGKMSPLQHGEVFITADGTETDLDLGHYERFIDEELNYTSSVTMGKVYANVIEKEKQGVYDGGTIQVVPHITNEIKSLIYAAEKTSNADFVITEIGGTIGDFESSAFLETLRQMRNDLGKERVLFIHMTLVPYLFGSGELKTKPTQHSVIQLRSLGIESDIIVTRSSGEIGQKLKKKIALFSSIDESNIIEAIDVKNVYQIPMNFYKNHLDLLVLKQFNMKAKKTNIKYWQDLVEKVDSLEEEINITIAGPYVSLHDAYLSVVESLKHAAYPYSKKIKFTWLDTKNLPKDYKTKLKNTQAVVIAPELKETETSSYFKIIDYVLENKVPFLGLSDAMLFVLKYHYEKKYLKTKKIDTEIFLNVEKQLGNFEIKLLKDSLIQKIYNKKEAIERRRLRRIFNLKDYEFLNDQELIFTAFDSKNNLAAIELPQEKLFIACQYRPEFLSRPNRAHPLFNALIESIINKKS